MEKDSGLKRSRLSTILLYVLAVLVLVIMVYPFFYTAMSAFKTPEEFVSKAQYALPDGFYIGNIKYVLLESSIPRYFLNSLIILVCVLVPVLLFGSMAAFAICKLNFKGQKMMLSYFLMGLMIPLQVCLIPLYLTFGKLGMTDSFLGVILPQIAFDFPYTIYLFTNFFKFLPNDVLESCILDGCSPFKMYSVIVVPMAKNIFLTLATMNGIFCWNEFVFAYTFTSSKNLQTITLGLRDFVGMYGATDWGRTFTTITLTILPTFILYFFLSKYMLAGMTEGAVKG